VVPGVFIERNWPGRRRSASPGVGPAAPSRDLKLSSEAPQYRDQDALAFRTMGLSARNTRSAAQ